MWPTIIVATIVAAILLAIIYSSIKNRRSGKTSCSSGSCCGCAASSLCHGQGPDEQTKT